MSKTVFISWSGDIGKVIARGLAETIFSHPELTPFVSSVDIRAGENWFNAIDRALDAAEFGVGVLTPGASVRPWINFEAAYIYSRLKRFTPLLFHEQVGWPLTILQAKNGMSREDLTQVLGEMITKPQQAKDWIEFKFREFEQVLENLGPRLRPSGRASDLERLETVARQLQENPTYRDNPILARVVNNSIRRLIAQVEDLDDSYSVPASFYPVHLIRLQHPREGLDAITRAVALVNQHETFWQDALGREILETSREENERVFVFSIPEDLERSFHTLQAHARRYTVRVMSLANLTREFEPFNKDFSIIEALESRILATYDHSVPHSTIAFWADPVKIVEHEKAFRTISRFPLRVDPENDDVDGLKQKVFTQRMTGIDWRHVEMSAYIPIDDYDKHEERHAYFVPMMERMIQVFEAHRGGRTARLLELGAGTGIFTRRLAALRGVDVEAVEIDWACYRRLVYNLRDLIPEENLHNQDSRTFDPNDTFDAIFSSFADHHVRALDREIYFENVKRNLRPGALFIVGDEFLPPHDPRDREARVAALETYHRHIIEQADDPVLIRLEEQALKSGIEERGDFKTSIEEYTAALRKAGFQFDVQKIGPTDRNDVGGVYVVVARL